MNDLPDVRAGDALSASAENALRAEVRRLGRIRAGAGIDVRSGSGGFSIAAITPGARIWIELTSSYTSPGYAWKEVTRSGGSWVDTGVTGSVAADPAIEITTGDTTLTSGTRRYPAERSETTGELLFIKV